MPAPAELTWRCRRDWRCEGRVAVHDPESGDFLGWEPGRPARSMPDGLCTVCQGRFEAALVKLPRLLDDLNEVVGRDSSALPPDTEFTSTGKKNPPIPLHVHIEAIRAQLDHEACQWADELGQEVDGAMYAVTGPPGDPNRRVERFVGPLEWGHDRLRKQRLNPRVLDALAFLRRRAGQLLALPPTRHLLPGTGEFSAHSLDDELVTVTGIDRGRSGIAVQAWASLDGIDAACSLIDVADRAERVIGQVPTQQRSAVPCTQCGNNRMHRWPGETWWRCPRCHALRREDHQEDLLAALLRSHPTRRAS